MGILRERERERERDGARHTEREMGIQKEREREERHRFKIHEDQINENFTGAKHKDHTVCSCRHSKSSAWVRSKYCVCRPYCVQL